MSMPFKLLSLFLICTIQVNAQNNYVTLGDAKKNSEYIALENRDQIFKFIKKSRKFESCIGLKVDSRFMCKTDITQFFNFIQTQASIKTLELRYMNNDSLDFTAFKALNQLEHLGLQNANCVYPNKEQLDPLSNLFKLTLYINSLDQIPPTIYQLSTIGELDLCSEKMPTNDPSYLYFYYALNDSLDNAIEINSYCENIDLSVDSIKKECFALWPKAEERKNKTYLGGSEPNRNMLGMTSPTAYYQPIPVLQPLNKKATIKFDNQSINPSIENQLVFNDQTVLKIPPDAFVTIDGKLVEENVNILYRSIRTPLEIMQSGITLFYDTAGQKELFKTNGMFEIRAFANSQELKLAPNKQIGVDFATKKDSTNFNLYALNDQTGKWQYKKPLSVQTGSIPYAYINFVMKDKTPFAERYTDLTYNNVLSNYVYDRVKVPHLSLRKQYANEYFSLGKLGGSGKFIKEGISQIRLKINYELTNNKLKKVFFYLFNPYNKPNVNPIELFPELKPFDGFSFEYDGALTSKEFNKQFKKGKVYNDIRIFYENNEETALIELKTKTEFIQIRVKTILTNALGKTRPNKGFKRAYRKYLRLLNIKEIKFNQTINKTYSRGEKMDTNFYYKYSVFRGKNFNTTAYQLNIDVLGFFNCDQLYRLKQPIQLVASQFKCEDKVVDGIESIYVVDLDANGTYSFDPNTIVLSYKSVGGLIFKHINGDLYTCTGESLRAQINEDVKYQNAITLKVEKAPLSKAEEMVKSME